MVSFPPCKINLGLNVISKRADGYHNLVTCFYPVQWCDILEIIVSHSFSFTASGNFIPGNNADNLCVKAYELLRKDFDLSAVAIHLHKIIPTGAGLGGGSSDAAHTLRLLNRIFDLQLSDNTLKEYAAKLGSDCAFFIEDKPMLGTGRGEILSPVKIDLKKYHIVLVQPGIHVSTAEAYAGIRPVHPKIDVKAILEGYAVEDWRQHLINDFEESVFRKHPSIETIKNKLYENDAVYACMSGSGSAVFGIFKNPLDLKAQFTGMQYWSGQLC